MPHTSRFRKYRGILWQMSGLRVRRRRSCAGKIKIFAGRDRPKEVPLIWQPGRHC
jgi:hypothetical protein